MGTDVRRGYQSPQGHHCAHRNQCTRGDSMRTEKLLVLSTVHLCVPVVFLCCILYSLHILVVPPHEAGSQRGDPGVSGTHLLADVMADISFSVLWCRVRMSWWWAYPPPGMPPRGCRHAAQGSSPSTWPTRQPWAGTWFLSFRSHTVRGYDCHLPSFHELCCPDALLLQQRAHVALLL